MIEDVIDLPTKLKRALLTKLYVLEERQVVVEDRRHSDRVPRHVANLPGRERLGETCDVEGARRACRIDTEVTFHRIAKHKRTRIDSTAGEISDRRADLRRRSRRR